ncbi:MAG: HYR domain-containing protein, partial [Bacteroidota bacterium]
MKRMLLSYIISVRRTKTLIPSQINVQFTLKVLGNLVSPRLLLVLCLFIGLSNQAQQTTWYLDNITFDGGATASGSFDFNTTTSTYSNIIITVTNSPNYGAVSFTTVASTSTSSSIQFLTQVAPDQSGLPTLILEFSQSLAIGGGNVSITPGISSYLGICNTGDCQIKQAPFEDIASGRVTTDPPPTAICRDFLGFLSPAGNLTLLPSNVDNGSSDNTAGFALSLDRTNFTCADIGLNTVTLTITDSNGSTDSCTATYTIVDLLLPTISCPSDIMVNNDAGLCNASVTVPSPTVGDNCSVASVTNSFNNSSDASGTYPLGTTSVIWTVTDASGRQNTCVQQITVVDAEAPTISCLSDITVNNDVGLCSASVTVPSPTVGDNCSVASVTNSFNNSSDASGTYPVGTTSVIWTVTDASGKQSSCTQQITVVDNEAPTISCSSDITVDNDIGQCSALVTVPLPTVGDNCSVVSVTNSFTNSPDASGTYYPVGTTLVVWTVTDASGRQSSCTQQITVIDNETPAINCPSDISLSCPQTVIYAFPTNSDNCGFPAVPSSVPGFSLLGSFGDSTYFISQSIMDLQAAFAIAQTNGYDLLTINSEAENEYIASIIPGSIGLGYNDLVTEGSFVWQSGQPVFYENWSDGDPSSIGDSRDYVQMLLDGKWYNTGSTSITRVVIEFHDYSTGRPIQVAGLPPGSLFTANNTMNTFFRKDISGNISTCSFTVFITDTTAPTVTCPSDISVNADMNSCSANVMVPIPVLGDDCGANIIPMTPKTPYNFDASGGLINTPTIMNNVPMATADVELRVTFSGEHVGSGEGFVLTGPDDGILLDLVSLNSRCIEVERNITIPSATWNAWISSFGSDLTFTVLANPLVDNNVCVNTDFFRIEAVSMGTLSLINDFNGTTDASGSYPLGVTTVTWTVTDLSGNSSSCIQSITVNETEAPMISCPTDIIVNADNGICTATVNYQMPTVTDNCSSFTNTLQNVLNNFNQNSGQVTNLIPNVYNFEMDGTLGVNGDTINDGGGDMYDDGNLIGTDLSTGPINYSDNTIIASTAFGANGAFFTRKVDNMWLLAADLDNVTSFNITGNLGADSDGLADGFTSTITIGDVNYNLFVKRVREDVNGSMGSDPSVNHLIIIPENTNTSQNFSADTDNDQHQVTGLLGTPRLYYLLFASVNSGLVDNSTMEAIATSFVTNIFVNPGTLQQTAGLPSGSAFPVGTTTNTFVATDASGNQSTCSFTVTVNEAQAPTINCPSDISLSCPEVVTYASPTISGGCGFPTVPASVTGFTLLGSFEDSTYFISDNDMTGSQAFAMAEANGYELLTINSAAENDYIASTLPSLSTTYIGYNDVTTEGTFVWQSGQPNFYENWRDGGPSTTGDSSDYVTINRFGQWLNISNVNTRSVIIEFHDYSTGRPIQVTGKPSGSLFTETSTLNTFFSEDNLGNISTCSFTVSTNDTTPPSIACQPDITINADVDACSAAVSTPIPTVMDVCGSTLIPISPRVPYNFDSNGRLIDTPAILPNAFSVTEDVTLTVTYSGDHSIDVENFILVGPNNSTLLNVTRFQCVLLRDSFTVPMATWNSWVSTYGNNLTFTLQANTNVDSVCEANSNFFQIEAPFLGNLILSNNYTGISDASGTYPIGTTQVLWTVTDLAGNSATCTQTITVMDTTPPVMSCPSDLNINTDPGLCSTVVDYSVPTATDNCTLFTNSLQNVLNNFNSNSQQLTNLIPDVYNFEMDGTLRVNDNNIDDGGGDMYDVGNFIGTDLNSGPINYSDNTVTASTAFGTNGAFFTRKVDNMWLLAADLDNVNTFDITGELGADSDGLADGFTSTITVAGVNYNLFVKRVREEIPSGGNSDPSVNHLIIIPENANATQNFSLDTDNDQHQVTGLNGTTRLYYLLFASDNSGLVDNATMEAIATSFITNMFTVSQTVVQTEGLPSGSAFPVGTTTNTFTATDASGNTSTCSFTVMVNDPLGNCGIKVSPKVYLQGSTLNSTIATDGLMRDDLRAGGLMPLQTPYTDTSAINGSVLSVTGPEAIVDWVWAELRDATVSTTIIEAKSALLQRDGDIVGLDGTSPLSFNAAPGSYHVAVKHRNHIGIITASPQTLGT